MKSKIFILVVLVVLGIFLLSRILLNNKVEASLNENYVTIIALDPGHGGEDTGAVSKNGINEKDIVLDIALMLGEKLSENNFKVVYTRDIDKQFDKDESRDIHSRTKIINKSGADIFLSIHLNGSDESIARGVETYSKYLDEKSFLLAQSIQDELSSIEYTLDRGVKDTSERKLGILRSANVTGALLELGFITNIEDEKYLTSKKGQNIITDCILNGILNYFEEMGEN